MAPHIAAEAQRAAPSSTGIPPRRFLTLDSISLFVMGLSTPVFLFHGQRSLEGYSPWDHKESNMTEGLTFSLSRFSTSSLLKKHFIIYLFWLCWVFAATHRLVLVTVSRGYSLEKYELSSCGSWA